MVIPTKSKPKAESPLQAQDHLTTLSMYKSKAESQLQVQSFQVIPA